MLVRSLAGIVMSAVFVLSGCATKAPQYSPSFQNVQKLADIQKPISLGEFSLAKPELDTVMLRAVSMTSPAGSFADYVKGAVTGELKMANKLGAAGSPELWAVIVENEYSSGSFISGSGKISARFTLKRDQKPVFDKTLTGTTTFPSSMMGSIAIANAARSYTDLVENLLGNLYSDADFINATK